MLAANGWEWVERVNTTGAVVIAAVTENRELVLVEQYRIPMGHAVIELPAGLAGDEAGMEHEEWAEAARRELLEETGYAADRLEFCTEGPSSAGLATEVYALYVARNARRVGPGGGVEKEEIRVHLVPLDGVHAWLEDRRRHGLMVDPKIYAGLYFATRPEPLS
jgi:ADP-ribose pyrophosphatase